MNVPKARHIDAIEAAIALAKGSGKREAAVSEGGMVVYANPQDEGRIAWGVHSAGFSHSGNIVEGIRQPDGSDTSERVWWDEPGDTHRDEHPVEPIEPLPVPTVDEVREWREVRDRTNAIGIHYYWTADGLAREVAYCEAEKRYKPEGLL